jgi:anti-sigma B factor antagonist
MTEPEEVESQVVALEGEIDLASRDDVLRRLITETTAPSVIVDLSAVTFADSSGLGAILDSLAALQAEGRTLRIIDPSHAVRILLELTSTAGLLGVDPNAA